MTVEETINGLRSMIQSKKFIEHDFNGVVDEDVCERAIELLKEQKPEIIRCKDCKYGDPGACEYGVDCDGIWHNDDWFCADGERR